MLDLLETRCSVWFAISCIAHICMTDMRSLISFFLILFHYWAAFVVYQQNWVNNTTSTWNSLTNIFSINHIQVGSFQDCSRIELQKCPRPKICHTYPTMMKLSKVIPYLRKFKTYINHVTHPLRFANNSIISLKISSFTYIKKYRYRLHFNT